MNKTKYELRKKLILPIIKLIDGLLLKIRKADSTVTKRIQEDEQMRNVLQSASTAVKKIVKKYDHKKGRLVWNSQKSGTYIRAMHGALR